jgi:hypothetical protein
MIPEGLSLPGSLLLRASETATWFCDVAWSIEMRPTIVAAIAALFKSSKNKFSKLSRHWLLQCPNCGRPSGTKQQRCFSAESIMHTLGDSVSSLPTPRSAHTPTLLRCCCGFAALCTLGKTTYLAVRLWIQLRRSSPLQELGSVPAPVLAQ